MGPAISPVIKITGNPKTYENLKDDMDINAGKALTGDSTLDEIADDIQAKVIEVAGGQPSASEKTGHQEFVLTYKNFDPLVPGCFPGI